MSVIHHSATGIDRIRGEFTRVTETHKSDTQQLRAFAAELRAANGQPLQPEQIARGQDLTKNVERRFENLLFQAAVNGDTDISRLEQEHARVTRLTSAVKSRLDTLSKV